MMMSHTALIAARYGGGTGPPKMKVLERILRIVFSSGVQVTKPPRQEKAFDSEPTMSTLSSVPRASAAAPRPRGPTTPVPWASSTYMMPPSLRIVSSRAASGGVRPDML